jgi:hypothetical protein
MNKNNKGTTRREEETGRNERESGKEGHRTETDSKERYRYGLSLRHIIFIFYVMNKTPNKTHLSETCVILGQVLINHSECRIGYGVID